MAVVHAALCLVAERLDCAGSGAFAEGGDTVSNIEVMEKLLEHHRDAFDDAQRAWMRALTSFSRVGWRERMALHKRAIEVLQDVLHDMRSRAASDAVEDHAELAIA